MRSKTFFATLTIAAVILLSSGTSQALKLHNFDCGLCHNPGAVWTSVDGGTEGNICLQCHGSSPTPTTLNEEYGCIWDGTQVVCGTTPDPDGPSATPGAGFSVGAASNELGSNPAAGALPGHESSHNWGAPIYNARAGSANNPLLDTMYTATSASRQGSAGHVTCFRCHDPHGAKKVAGTDGTNKLLRLPGYDKADPATMTPDGTGADIESTCVVCHADWAQYVDGSSDGFESHPLVVDYPTFQAANTTKYKPFAPNGDMALLPNGDMGCTTCHGLHESDSSSATQEGVDAPVAGDGALLKGDGVFNNQSSVCQSCHIYNIHPSGGQTNGTGPNHIGCLVCHSGHSYNDGNTNFYLLRDEVASLEAAGITQLGAVPGPKDGMTHYMTMPANQADAWGGTGPGPDGYCEQCHGDVEDAAFSGPLQNHTSGQTCNGCHNHSTTFVGEGCNGCHGYAPSTNTAGGPTGWANTPFDYSTDPDRKDEGTTPHITHSDLEPIGAGNYRLACQECHANFSSTHQNGVFDDVVFGATANTGGAANYNREATGNGSCDTVYCHSNGDPRSGTISYQATNPVWETGIGDITTCTVCHGNDNATMTTRGNSATHQVHLTKGYDCGVCHSTTATDNVSLIASAKLAGGDHVDGTKDVVSDLTQAGFAGSFTYVTDGTCQTFYCHSNGAAVPTYATPDWDLPASGQCGTCHGNTGATLPASHARHLSDTDGPQISDCSLCHTHNGSGPQHVDGTLGNVDYTKCQGCHGTNGGAGDDADLGKTEWTNGTATCESCHIGATSVIPIAGTRFTGADRAATAKNSFIAEGHGDTGLTGAPSCTGCHDDVTTNGHFDATSGDDDRLTGGATANDAFCQTCHTTNNSHYATGDTGGTTSTTGNTCAACHEPHGEGMGTGNTELMLIVGNNFTNRLARASFVNGSFNGVCQVCHVPGEVDHFTTAQENTGHFAGQLCSDCHDHADAPAFQPNATSCGACHDTLMATAPHSAHINKNSTSTIIEDDLSDCATCHDGADQYTLTGSVNGLHRNSTTNVAAGLGWNNTNKTCASACHTSIVADGAWTDVDGLDCDSCHANPPAGNNHSKHIAAGFNCDECHVAIPTDTGHINDFVVAVDTDGQILADMGDAQPNEANVVVSTWNGTNNTCANAACHNPSGDAHIADWDSSVSSCVLCHNNDVASGTPMATDSHQQHVNNAAIIGDNAVCTDCHTNPAGNMAHRDGSVGFAAAAGWGALAPQTCASNTSCHNDGYDPVQSPAWGAAVPANTVCDLCHEAPDNSGDHLAHWDISRTSKGLQCASCHFNTVNNNVDPLNTLTTIKAGGTHIDGTLPDVAEGFSYDSVPVDINPFTPGSPSTCTANCHLVNPKPWLIQTGCGSCHGDLSYVGAVHTTHIDITTSIDTDLSECIVCHGADIATYTITGGDGGSGNHQDSSIQTLAGIGTGAAGCAAACHDSSAADGNWADADGLNCTSCHNNGTNDNNIANAAPTTGAHANHVTTQSMTCDNCHDTGTAIPANTAHASGLNAAGAAGADQGETLTNKATPVANNATVDDRSFDQAGSTFDDGTNSCSNTYCHDPSSNTTSADWDTDTADCNLCHGYDRTSAAVMATGSHSKHLNAITKFGLSTLEDCLACHPDNTGNNGHFISSTGPTTVNQAAQLAGNVIDGATYSYTGEVALPDSGFGTCGTTPCHNNGQGGAPSGYTWATNIANDCNTCHNERPTTQSHNIHTGTTAYGPHPAGSTDCGECHAANANNTTMAAQSTHINGSRDYNDTNSVANHGGIFGAGTGVVGDTVITVCNNCHGGQTAADLAKNNWPTATAVGCESCHGAYNLANSQQDGLGAVAPLKGDADYVNFGHGKANTPASAIDGVEPVALSCGDCHNISAAGHLDGVSGDDTRLTDIAAIDYGVDPNGWCNTCHDGAMDVSSVHFANGGSGSSNDALLCTTCHDQHGQGGQDAMIASTVAGNTVSGFTARDQRGSYSNPGGAFDGICQVCHDPTDPTAVDGDIKYFNRTTEGAHNGTALCLDCHNHTDNPIFTPSGCNGCHGGGTTGASAANYWPDTTGGENDAGEHVKHMTVLAARVYDQTLIQILDDVASDTKQKALCEYCHAASPNDSNHAGTLNDAEVFVDADATRHAKNMWGGNDANAAYTPASDTCSNVDCHNSQTTTATYSWYATPGADNNADCVMCHTVGAVGANPTTGLHDITNTGTVQEHNDNLLTGCEECHVKPAVTSTSTHVDGNWNVESGVNNDRFLVGAVNFSEGVVNQTTCMPSGALSACHSDGGNWGRLWSTAADSTLETVGSARCDVCHGQLGNWRTGLTVDHNKAAINDGTHSSCETCHVQPAASYSFAGYHNTSSPFPDGGNINATELSAAGRAIEMNNNAGYNMTNNNCTNICHGNDGAHTLSGSTNFPAQNMFGPSPGCNNCHFDTGGGPNGNTIATSGSPYTFTGAGSHPKHNTTAANTYGDTALSSTTGQYNYGCANCHPIVEAGNHINGILNLTLNSTHGGALKSQNNIANDTGGYSQTNGTNVTCNAAFCHSDADGTFQTTPNWWAGTFTNPNGDYCQNCHGNQPSSNAHSAHVVGIHYDDVYTGTTGLLTDAAATNAGHGDVATAVTINCNLCHSSTLTQWRNDNNTVCNTCHNAEGNEIASNDVDLKKNFHVNGVKDIAFSPVDPLRSKAQVRDFTATETELDSNWTRVNGYKAGATSHDASKNSPPLNTGSDWDGTNCTVTCHNGNTIAWTATGVSCNNCHTQLPK